MSRLQHGVLLVGFWLFGVTGFRGAPLTHASRAAPTIIIFHGGPIVKPVRIASWHDNEQLLLESEPIARDQKAFWRSLDRRTSINVALFWGPEWRTYSESPAKLASLDPSRANQTGTYYPAVGERKAILVIAGKFGQLSEKGLAILTRYGIPTRML